jgi:hypothetical protein
MRGLIAEQITAVDSKMEQLADLRSRLVALASSLKQADMGSLATGVVCPCLQANNDQSAVTAWSGTSM